MHTKGDIISGPSRLTFDVSGVRAMITLSENTKVRLNSMRRGKDIISRERSNSGNGLIK